jgi:outer membrane lipoprotein
MARRLLFISLIIAFISGCAPVISKQIREQVSPQITFRDVLRDPDAYRNQMVIWSGVIVKSENTKEGTLIEVLQKATDSRGKPLDVDKSGGRFLALHSEYLDTAIYSKGREVTIAGKVLEKRVLPLGEIEYAYPLALIKEVYLWKPVSEDRWGHPYWWYYPHWWRYPYWHPYY